MANEAEVYLEKYAFEEIVRSCFEIPKVECMGYLFGNSYEKKNGNLSYLIKAVHPIQNADRFPSSIILDINDKKPKFVLLDEFIGDFHSHIESRVQKNNVRVNTKGKVSFSSLDRETFGIYPINTSLVVALNKIKKKNKVSNNNPFLISGYVEDNSKVYKFDIGAYWKNYRIRRAKIKTDPKMLKLIS